MHDPARGITCPDARRVVREALANGWEWGGYTGSTHAFIVWPATGERLTFGATPSVASWKSLATDIKRVSGVEVWRKGNRKRSRKADQLTGFDLDAARREAAERQRERDRIAAMQAAARAAERARIREFATSERHRREIENLMRAPGRDR